MGDMGGNCRHILFGALVLEWGLSVLHGNVRCGRALAIRPLYPLCHLARPIYDGAARWSLRIRPVDHRCRGKGRSEEHTSELQSLMRISYAVFCLKKK